MKPKTQGGKKREMVRSYPHMYIAHKKIRRTNWCSDTIRQFNSCSIDTSHAGKRTQNRQTLTLPWPLPDSQFRGVSCWHQNLPETFIHFGSILWIPEWVTADQLSLFQVIQGLTPQKLSGLDRPYASARKICMQFNHDYSLTLESKETSGAKMATLPARHPVSEGPALSDLQIQ